MSVLIKGMEMPNTCKSCVCSNYYERMDMILCDIMDKQLDEKQWKSERHHDCPLIEVHTPHGRLIDADAHILKIRKQYCEDCSRRKGIKNGKMKFLYEIGGVVCRACEIEDMLNELDDAPTVIEVEGEE